MKIPLAVLALGLLLCASGCDGADADEPGGTAGHGGDAASEAVDPACDGSCYQVFVG